MPTGLADGTVLNERYQIRAKLGEGGMAVVYRAYDLCTDAEVALKLMTVAWAPANLKRFAREFQTISALDHPNCIRVFDFGESSVGPFFTMELFSGFPISSLQGRAVPLLLDALYQATAALEYVHARGVVHRDVKPSNLLTRLTDSADGGRVVEVKLTDFGLARLEARPSSLSVQTPFLGTIPYCSPEQLRGGAVDHRADLYALGEVAYELLAGRHPFDSAMREGMESLVRSKLTDTVPPMALGPELADIARTISALLAQEPADRPHTAAGLKRAVAAFLGRGAAQDQPTASGVGPWHKTPFVGRSAELAAGSRLFRMAVTPHAVSRSEWDANPVPSVLFISGEPGIGKTEMQRQLGRMVEAEGVNVYEGRCFEGNLAPYQPFVDVLRQLLLDEASRDSRGLVPGSEPPLGRPGDIEATGAGEGRPTGGNGAAPSPSGGSFSTTFRALLGEYAAELLRIAPDLRRWLPGEAFRQIDLNRELQHVLRAVAGFFVELASVRATCLFLEDLQWADQSSLNLLQHLCSALYRARALSIDGNVSWPRLFICCTLRRGYLDATRYVGRLIDQRQAAQVDLRAFDRGDVGRLAAAILGSDAGRLPASLLDPLCDRSRGNPLFVEQMIRTWQSEGRLSRGAGDWHLSASAEASPAWPDSVREVLRGRVAPLSRDAQRVLGTAAIIGAVIDVDVLREASGDLSDTDFLAAVEELLAAHLLVETAGRPTLEFAHDLMRELAYSELSSSRRLLLHRRVGEILETRDARGSASTPEVLARHFSIGGVRDKALRYLTQAGESAVRSYAVEHAIRYLLEARDLAAASGPEEQRHRIGELLATAYGAAGQPIRAIGFYDEILSGTSETRTRARLFANLGDLYLRIGDFDKSVQYLDRALGALEHARPRSAAGATIRGAISFLPSLLPRRALAARPLAGERRETALIARRAYNSAVFLWAQRDLFQCLHSTARQWVLARRIGDAAHLADAYAKHSLFFGFMGLNRIALMAGHRALTYASEDGDPAVVAMAEGHVGIVHYFGGRLREAEELLRQALKVLDQRGDSWVRMLLYHNLRHVYALRGDTDKEMACAEVEWDIGERVDDSEGRCWGAFGLANALARSGRSAEAKDQVRKAAAAIAGRSNIIGRPTLLSTHGFVHLQAGDYRSAREVLEQARSMIEANWAYVDYPIRTYALLVESLLGPDWHLDAAPVSKGDLAAARLLSRKAVFWGRVFPNALPHAWRARGRAALARGARARAAESFQRAIDAATAIGARYDLARACLDLARLGGHGAAEHDRRARRLLEEMRAVAPPAELEPAAVSQ